MTEVTNESFIEDSHNTIPTIHFNKNKYHYVPRTRSDKVAKFLVHFLARMTDLAFKKRYGIRAIVLETVAAVPGMVGGLLQHLKALRFIRDDRGWIKALVDEAENERIHLLVYSQIASPSYFEKISIMVVQFFFYHMYFLVYLISPKTAHRFVGYLEEEAIHSYTTYLSLIEDGTVENVEAPHIAKVYWNLPEGARLKEVVLATIEDEIIHRDVNHQFAEDKIGTSLWK